MSNLTPEELKVANDYAQASGKSKDAFQEMEFAVLHGILFQKAKSEKRYLNLMRASHGVVKWFTPDNPEHPVAKLKSEWEKIKNEDILLEVQRSHSKP